MNSVFAYIRVSTVKQGERGSSLAEQRLAIERYAQQHGLTITSWFEEKETAAKRGREQFSLMLKMLLAGKAQGVVIHKIDRGARNLKDWADLGGLIDKGIQIHFAHESLDMQSRGGRLAADIQAVVAADYIRNLRDEVKKGFYGRLRQGLYPLPAPIGYKDQGRGLPKIPDPIMAPYVQKAFELYASGSYNLHSLGKEMFEMGLRNKGGGRVSKTGLSTMLNNEFYIGIIHIARTNERFQGIHEPLISKSLFDNVQAVLQGRTKSKGLKYNFRYRKTLRCYHCGYSLIAESQKGIVYYRCQQKSCPVTCVREDSIDNQFRIKLQEVALTSEQIQDLEIEFTRLDSEQSAQTEDLLKTKSLRVSKIDKKISRLTDAYIDRLIDRETYNSKRNEYLHERAKVADDLKLTQQEIEGKFSRRESFLELVKTIRKAVEKGNEYERRDTLKKATSNLSVDQKSLEITWKSPFGEVVKNKNLITGTPFRDRPRTKKKGMSEFAKKLYKLLILEEQPNGHGSKVT